MAASSTDPYIGLAKSAIEEYVRTGKAIHRPSGLPKEMAELRAGAFVSIHDLEDLRGCIGTIGPTTECVADEIIQNAISACSKDPRFLPVEEFELDDLSYSVDILEDPEPVSSQDELDCKRYGVIVTKGWKRGLLLPNLDGVDSVDEQLRIAKLKAGIDPYDDNVEIERFEVIRHGSK